MTAKDAARKEERFARRPQWLAHGLFGWMETMGVLMVKDWTQAELGTIRKHWMAGRPMDMWLALLPGRTREDVKKCAKTLLGLPPLKPAEPFAEAVARIASALYTVGHPLPASEIARLVGYDHKHVLLVFKRDEGRNFHIAEPGRPGISGDLYWPGRAPVRPAGPASV